MEISLIVLLVAIVGMSVFSSRQNKKRQQEVVDFRSSLEIGDEVMTSSGLIGKIVEKDDETNSFVIESEGSKSRWLQDAITKNSVKPEEIADQDTDLEDVEELESKGNIADETSPENSDTINETEYK